MCKCKYYNLDCKEEELTCKGCAYDKEEFTKATQQKSEKNCIGMEECVKCK